MQDCDDGIRGQRLHVRPAGPSRGHFDMYVACAVNNDEVIVKMRFDKRRDKKTRLSEQVSEVYSE